MSWLDDLISQMDQGGADAVPSEAATADTFVPGKDSQSASDYFNAFFEGGNPQTDLNAPTGVHDTAPQTADSYRNGSDVMSDSFDAHPKTAGGFGGAAQTTSSIAKMLGLATDKSGSIDYTNPKTIDALTKLILGGGSVLGKLLQGGQPVNYKTAAQLQSEIKNPLSNWTPQQQTTASAFFNTPMQAGTNRQQIYAADMKSPIVPGKGYAGGGTIVPFSPLSASYAAYGGTPAQPQQQPQQQPSYGTLRTMRPGALAESFPASTQQSASQPQSNGMMLPSGIPTRQGGPAPTPNFSSVLAGLPAAMQPYAQPPATRAPTPDLPDAQYAGQPFDQLPLAWRNYVPGYTFGVSGAPLDPSALDMVKNLPDGRANPNYGQPLIGNLTQEQKDSAANSTMGYYGFQNPWTHEVTQQQAALNAKTWGVGTGTYDNGQIPYQVSKSVPFNLDDYTASLAAHPGNELSTAALQEAIRTGMVDSGLIYSNYDPVTNTTSYLPRTASSNVPTPSNSLQLDPAAGLLGQSMQPEPGARFVDTSTNPNPAPNWSSPAPAPNTTGPVSSAQINSWLAANPSATDSDIASAMNSYGVSPQQMADATGLSLGSVQQRYDAASPPAYARGGGINAQRPMPSRGALGHVVASTGGQDDVVPINAAGGEYMFDADTVSALGDGNNAAGAKKLDQMRASIRRHKRSAPPTSIPPKAKPIAQYMKGGR